MKKIQIYTLMNDNTMLPNVISLVIVHHIQASVYRATHHPTWWIQVHSGEILQVCHYVNTSLRKESHVRKVNRCVLTCNSLFSFGLKLIYTIFVNFLESNGHHLMNT